MNHQITSNSPYFSLKFMRISIFIFTLSVLLLNPIFATNLTRVHTVKDGYSVFNEKETKALANFKTPKEAIVKALSLTQVGGTIELSRGCYKLSSPLKLKNGITLRGQGRGTELRLSGKNNIAVSIEGLQDVTIKHLAVTAGPQPVADSNGVKIHNSKNIILGDVLVVGFKNYGIFVKASNEFKIQNSYIVGNDKGNIVVEDMKKSDKYSRIASNIFLWGGVGVKTTKAQKLIIDNCIVQQTFGIPLDLHGDDVKVTANRSFYAESLDADVLIRGSKFWIGTNTFCWGRGNGIAVDGATNVTITENNIIDHGTPPGDDILKSGVLLRNGASQVKIFGNAIWNWDDWTQGPMRYGIEELEGCKNNSFVNNVIQFYEKGDILSKGTGTHVEGNVSDIGWDDQDLLPDFDVWRKYITDFINKDLQQNNIDFWLGEDYVISQEKDVYRATSTLTGKVVYSHKDARATIQWAIDQFGHQGGRVELSEGTYPIKNMLWLKKNVWLQGQGNKSILKAEGEYDICVRMSHATQGRISDLKIINAGKVNTGIGSFHSLASVINNVHVEGFRKFGIDFIIEYNLPKITWGSKAVSSLVLVKNNSLINNWESAVEIPHHGAYIGNAVPNLITKNLIIGGGYGINCAAICTNITYNVICNTYRPAVIMDGNSIITVGNTVYRCGNSAIVAFDGKQTHANHATYDRQDNNNNKECNITRNLIVDTKGHGVEVSEQWGVIGTNQIINNGVGNGQRYGVFLHEDSETYVVFNNDIYNTPEHYSMPIGIRETGFNNLVASNRISDVRVQGVKFRGEKGVERQNTVTKTKKSFKGEKWAFDNKVNSEMSYYEVLNYVKNKVKNYQK